MAQVDRLLNSGMQKPGNRGNEASVDCVLVKMSVKTENQGRREMREGLKPEEGKNRNYLPPTLVRMINAICDILVTARAQWRRDKREPPISGAHKGSNLIGHNSHPPKTTWEPVLTVRSSQRVSPKGCVTAEAETAMEGSLHVDFTVPVLSSLK